LSENKVYYLLFHTIHDVLRAEKALKAHCLDFELIPVPRNLSSDCGSCVKLNGNINNITQYLQGIEVDKCYLFDGKEYIAVDMPHDK